MIEATILYYEKEPTPGMRITGNKRFFVNDDDVALLQEVCAASGWKLETKPVFASSVKVIVTEVSNVAKIAGQ